MDRGAWRATDHGIAKSRTRLSDSAQHSTVVFELAASRKKVFLCVKDERREESIMMHLEVLFKKYSIMYMFNMMKNLQLTEAPPIQLLFFLIFQTYY